MLLSASSTIRENINPQGEGAQYPQTPHTVSNKPTHVPGFPTHYSNVIFDLGDVLFTYSTSSSHSPVPSHVLKPIFRSSIWFEYDKGNITEDETYAQVAKAYSLSATDVACVLSSARDSLKSSPVLIDTIKAIRASGRRIFVMSNMLSS